MMRDRGQGRRKPGLGSVAVIAVTVLAGSAAASELNPPTPPLLQGAVAGGGCSAGGCPPNSALGDRAPGEAHSSNVVQRLAREFPPGTAEEKLLTALREQGFQVITPCEGDPTIHRAVFAQKGGGGLWGPYPIFANIAWKIDGLGRIVWSKANVAYTGP